MPLAGGRGAAGGRLGATVRFERTRTARGDARKSRRAVRSRLSNTHTATVRLRGVGQSDLDGSQVHGINRLSRYEFIEETVRQTAEEVLDTADAAAKDAG